MPRTISFKKVPKNGKKSILWIVLFFVLSCQESEYNSRMVQFFLKGNQALQQEDYSTALRYYNAGIEIDSTFADIYNNRGIIFFEINQLEKALTDYNKALSIKPDFANALFNRSNLYYTQEVYDKSLQDLDKLIELLPDSAEMYFYRARTHLQLFQYEAAQKDLNHLISKQASNATGYDSRAYLNLKLGNYAQARKDLEKALQLDENLDLAWANWGFWHTIRQPESDSALLCFEKALTIKPDEAYTLARRAEYWIVKNDLGQAAQDIKQAQKIDAKNAQVRLAEVKLFLKKEQINEAFKMLEALEAEKKLLDEVYLLWGECYLKQDKIQKACEFWQKTEKINTYPAATYLVKYCQKR